jgi:hypothetical protein
MAVVTCIIVPFGLPKGDYVRTVLWAFAVLASAIGWGAGFVTLFFRGGPPFDWGLKGALGLSVHLAVGGVLAMLSLVSSKTTFVAVALGVAIFAVEGWRGATAQDVPAGVRRHARSSSAADVTVLSLFFAVVLLHFLGMAGERSGNKWDDYEAYFTYPKQLLGSGSLIEPFSVRRIATYGGQSYLHALVLVFSTVFRLGVVDNGICFLLLGGLALGWVRERPRLGARVAALPLIGLAGLPHEPHNSASELSGAVFFFALFRLLDRPRGALKSPIANALAGALVMFGACTLRQSNLIPAAAIVAAWYAVRILRDPAARPAWVREAALAGACAIGLLLPWMILAYRSSRTLLYPVFQGNAIKEFGLFEPISIADRARFFVACVLHSGPLPGILLAFTAALVMPSRRDTTALRACLAGTAVGAIALFVTLASADDLISAHRYFLPFELGFFLSACVAIAGAERNRGGGQDQGIIAISLITGAVVLEFSDGRDTLCTIYLDDIDAIKTELRSQARPPPNPADAEYARLQHTVPEHEPLLVMLDEPFRLDFERNRIVSWDQPGAASPRPHLPVGRGPEALAQYLQGLGLRYLAFQLADLGGSSPEYTTTPWKERLDAPIPGYDMKSRAMQLRAAARFYVDIFGSLKELATSRKHLFAENGTFVLDLATRSAPP